MAKRDSQCVTWDFRTSADPIRPMELKLFLKTKCKKWVFQKEKGESGYIHYQGRFSLIKKLREKPVIDWLMNLKEKYPTISFWIGRTTTANLKKEFYVTKEETRIEGPWRDTDIEEQPVEEDVMPRALRQRLEDETFTWYDWQEDVIISFGEFEERKINIIIDHKGNSGKSFLKTYLGCRKLAMCIPVINDYKDIMRMVMDRPKVGGYIIDMPRALPKSNLKAIFSAIEDIKNGYAFDDRYQFKEEYFDNPVIWVFMNAVPEMNMLSNDRWNIYKIVDTQLKWYNNEPKVQFVIVPDIQECVWEPEDNKIALGGPVI